MCLSPSIPKAPAAVPVQAPPPVPVLDVSNGNATENALSANRGRSTLRIDKTGPSTGATGNGLNIPL